MTSDKEEHKTTEGRSRDSLKGAGWEDCKPGVFQELMLKELEEHMPREDWKKHHSRLNRGSHFSWLNPLTWWQSRNDVIAHFLSDPVNKARRRLVDTLLTHNDVPKDLVIDRSDLDSANFIVIGDTGEGDESQWALVPPLQEHWQDTQFMIVCSDVIYPAGNVNEYLQKFCIPYRRYPNPIYALPGNHDWDDGALKGFMRHFCDVEASSELPQGSSWILKRLWRKPEAPDPELLERCRSVRPKPDSRLKQPAPYFAIDTGPVRIVNIDTGITGELDSEQGEWLEQVSSDPSKPKILLTGKPIYVDGEHHPGKIEGATTTVDEIVCKPEHKYVAAIGGDIHNYQRYPVKVGNRTIQYIVSGGGGAYMSDTHRIPKITPDKVPGVDEASFKCYPLRGDSLSIYSRVLDRRFFFGLGLIHIPPDEASALIGERLGIEPTRPPTDRDGKPSRRKRVVSRLPFLRTPRRFRGRRLLAPFFYPFFSEVFDWDDPPFFKNFLRLTATKSKLTITCYGVTGCRDHEENPPKEDHVEISLGQF